MTNYNMLFEEIVLGAWDKLWRREDPFKMGDADTLGLVDDNLSGQYGQDAKCRGTNKASYKVYQR